MRALLAMIVVSGCGFTAAGGGAPIDAPIDDVIPIDTVDADPPSSCIAKWLSGTVTLSTPAVVLGVGSSVSDERDPFLSSTELEIYWVAQNGGDTDIFFATRVDLLVPFSGTAVKTSLSDNNQNDSKIALSGDDLTVIQATQRGGGEGGFDLWQATRSSAGTQAFPALTQEGLATLNDNLDQLDPELSNDGLRLYYAAGSPQRIVLATRATPTAVFDAPVDVPSLMSGAGDADPSLTGDERVIVFASNRADGIGNGDMWYATRQDTSNNFSAPMLVPMLNGAGNDGDPHISNDGCRVYFSSSRSGGGDIFISTVN